MSLCLLYFLLLLLCRLINMDTQHEQGRGHTQGLARLQGAARTQVNVFGKPDDFFDDPVARQEEKESPCRVKLQCR
jgi:hypothetical protein